MSPSPSTPVAHNRSQCSTPTLVGNSVQLTPLKDQAGSLRSTQPTDQPRVQTLRPTVQRLLALTRHKRRARQADRWPELARTPAGLCYAAFHESLLLSRPGNYGSACIVARCAPPQQHCVVGSASRSVPPLSSLLRPIATVNPTPAPKSHCTQENPAATPHRHFKRHAKPLALKLGAVERVGRLPCTICEPGGGVSERSAVR